eukprot:488796-Pyramimonas_sp.AAC.1
MLDARPLRDRCGDQKQQCRDESTHHQLHATAVAHLQAEHVPNFEGRVIGVDKWGVSEGCREGDSSGPLGPIRGLFGPEKGFSLSLYRPPEFAPDNILRKCI